MVESRKRRIGLLGACLLAGALLGADEVKRTWTFDDEAPGQIARGFTNEAGDWKVVASEKGQALAQVAKNAGPEFNIALVSDTQTRDIDLTVRMKAIAGEHDQGGGLVWRATGAKNYYLARYNPLEDNFRVYKVVNGKRTQFESAEIPHTSGWHTLRVTMQGDQIECYLDGKKSLEVRDSTFSDSGKVGLWSKADAQSQFDDLTLVGR